MSSQKGNSHRTRPQKHQNRFEFKNDLHDKSQKTKILNSIQVAKVCQRCKKIIEWKIKYKKFKPLKCPAKCTKCDQKVVKHAYHIMCEPCARERDVCPKCGDNKETLEAEPSQEEQMKLDVELQKVLKTLPERKRRTLIRFMNHKEKKELCKTSPGNDAKSNANSQNVDKNIGETSREILLEKLELLSLKKSVELDDSDLDFDDDAFDSIE